MQQTTSHRCCCDVPSPLKLVPTITLSTFPLSPPPKMSSPPPPPPPPPPPLPIVPDELFDYNLDEPSSTQFEWANLLDFTFEDQFNFPWSPNNETVNTPSVPASESQSEASNRGGSSGSDKIRKRDPRLTCENFLAGRIPCACPEEDEKAEEEEGEIGKKRARTAKKSVQCQIPGCEIDISELKGYHKRHKVCLRCANATSVLLDGQAKRYCQQCGKFHILPDFDEGKRSCRRKLEKHNNRRRRKPTQFREAVDTQIEQLTEDNACEDKEGRDETPNESEDGTVSPLSLHPASQSIQSESVKSFVTFDEIQMEGGKDNSKCSSYEDNKNNYSSVCPTGRISFKLYDWNPAEFPRRLRHQIFQWLASMPVELEGYIRPGCIILTVFIAMPHFMWEKLTEDAAQHIHNFVNAPENMLFGRGSMTVYLNDMIFRVLKGGTSLLNVEREVSSPRLHYVHPCCFEAGKPMEFIVCGSNLLQSRFRFLISFGGRYLAYDDCYAIPNGRTRLCYGPKEDSVEHYEHQIYKIYISTTDPTVTGPAFVEVENESGISNFIPVLFGDKYVCSEMKMVQCRLDDVLFPKEVQNAAPDANSEPCMGFVLRQAAISELLLDIGWLLKEPSLDETQHNLTRAQIQSFNYLLSFLIRYESTIVLEKILHSLKIIMDTKKLYNHDNRNNDADMKLFQRNVEHARAIVCQRRHKRVKHVSSGNSVGKQDYWSECYGESNLLSAEPSTSEDMEMAKKKLGSVATDIYQSSESDPLLIREFVVNLTNEPHPANGWQRKTCNRFLSTTLISTRPLFLAVAASVVCFGICAVLLHPNKVGKFAVSIHRCLFGSSET